MIEGLKTYAEYKESGVPWLGKIPKSWDIRRGKYLFKFKKELNSNALHTNVLSLTMRGVVNNNPDDPVGMVPKDYASYQLFRRNDLVFKLIDLENFKTSRVGLVHEDGIMSPAYIRLSINNGSDIRYFYHQFFDLYLRGVFNQLGAGVRATLGQNDLLDLGVVLPGLEEQTQIVRYLDTQDRRINRLIRDKRRLIELLKEQKQAIIHQAVTCSFKPNVRLRPSGINWLGDVPEHWEVWKIGQFAKVGNGSTPSRGKASYWSNSEYPWLNSASVNQFTITKADQFVTELALKECHLPKVQPGSVLVAITGQGKTRGTAAVLNIEATINQHMVYISPRTASVFSDYLQMFLIAAYTELRSISNDSGSTKGALTCEAIKHFKVALPPTDEQHRLVRAVRQEFAKNEATVMRVRREIDLLHEFRTRLISDVITGKLDVRGVDLLAMDGAEVPEDIEIGEDTEAEDLFGSEEVADADE